METYNANDLFVIRPMKLITQEKYGEAYLPYIILKHCFSLCVEYTKQDYLSLAKDIQIAEKGTDGKTFEDIFSNNVYPTINNNEFPNTDFNEIQNTSIVHLNYVKRLSDILIKNHHKLPSINQTIDNGIYGTWINQTNKSFNKIDDSSFDLNQLHQFKAKIIAKEKNRLVSIKRTCAFDYMNYHDTNVSIEIHSKVVRKEKLHLLDNKTRH